MPDDAKRSAARKIVRDAQEQFERDAEAVREARRKAFAGALVAGLSLREIAEETGLHHSTVSEIARGRSRSPVRPPSLQARRPRCCSSRGSVAACRE